MFEVIFSRGVDGRESADGAKVYTLIRIVVHLLKQFDGLCPVDLVMFFVGWSL